MSPLLEVQRRLRNAIVGGKSSAVAPLLVGGADPGERLAIHRRHYETSLVSAILDKFPATTWLIGSSIMHDAARAFVGRHPPTTPCIAEYGEGFPRLLAERDEARDLPYLYWFAELEWHLGHVAIAVDRPALSLQCLADCGDRLGDVELVAQPGLRYLASPWPVDDLMRLYLTDTAPQRYLLSAGDIWLEIFGSRGTFRFIRLERGEFLFRQAIVSGGPLGAAAERALEADKSLDVGAALRRFVADALVTEIRSPQATNCFSIENPP